MSRLEGEALPCWVSTHGGGQDAGPVWGGRASPTLGWLRGWSRKLLEGRRWPRLPRSLACSTSCPVLRFAASGGRVLCLPGDPLSERPPHCLPDARHCCHPCANYHRKYHFSPCPPNCCPTASGDARHPRGPSHASCHQGERPGFLRVPRFGQGGWAGRDSAAVPGHRPCACRASGACDFWMFLAWPVMQTRRPRLGGCGSHSWRGQAALEPQLLCPDTPAVHGPVGKASERRVGGSRPILCPALRALGFSAISVGRATASPCIVRLLV